MILANFYAIITQQLFNHDYNKQDHLLCCTIFVKIATVVFFPLFVVVVVVMCWFEATFIVGMDWFEVKTDYLCILSFIIIDFKLVISMVAPLQLPMEELHQQWTHCWFG